MPVRTLSLIVTLLGLLAFSVPAADAQPSPWSSVVIPQTRGFSNRANVRGVQVDRVDATVHILEQTARTTLEIALRNPGSQREEAMLLLPVPDGAVISGFAFDGVSTGPTVEVLARDDARRIYDRIVAELRDPALLEFAGYCLIRSSVFPVEAGGTQRVRVTYEHILDVDGERVDYVLPRSESLDVRVPWTIRVKIDAERPIASLYSPSHPMVAERRGPGAFDAAVQVGVDRPGPFRLSYLRESGAVSASLFAYPDAEVGGGYFLLMAGLPATIAPEATLRREVTLVVDRSGSMAGEKMDQVRAAVTQVVEGLADGEAFNIIDYSTRAASFAAQPVVKSPETTAAARRYLAALRPTGGTNIHEALRLALDQPPTAGTIPMILFLTDGLPTVGRTAETEIAALAETHNPHQRRVFTFGVGSDVNVPLLDRIAAVTRGTNTYVLAGEDVEVKVAQVFQKLYGPVLSDVRLETLDTSGSVSTRLIREPIPDPLPDLFEGDQLILLGQYLGAEPVTFRLSGRYLGQPRAFSFTFGFERANVRNAFVPRLWASRRIAMLVDEVRQAGASSAAMPATPAQLRSGEPRLRELTDEILRLSTRFGILTEYTAFLATDGTDLANKEALILGCSTNLRSRAVQDRSGLSAVNQGLNLKSQREQGWVNNDNRYFDAEMKEVAIYSVQQVCDRAFFRRGDQWIDARLFEGVIRLEPDEIVTWGSDRFHDIARRLTAQGRPGVLSLTGASSILMLFDGRVVRIDSPC